MCFPSLSPLHSTSSDIFSNSDLSVAFNYDSTGKPVQGAAFTQHVRVTLSCTGGTFNKAALTSAESGVRIQSVANVYDNETPPKAIQSLKLACPIGTFDPPPLI